MKNPLSIVDTTIEVNSKNVISGFVSVAAPGYYRHWYGQAVRPATITLTFNYHKKERLLMLDAHDEIELKMFVQEWYDCETESTGEEDDLYCSDRQSEISLIIGELEAQLGLECRQHDEDQRHAAMSRFSCVGCD